jgi:tetratricopeptide (TPR) repeat protein
MSISMRTSILATSFAALATLAGASLIAPHTAAAQSASAQATAEDYYTKGDTAYNLGRYADAADWFTKAYEAWPQPEFLYNIAQSYRLGGNCKQALHFYKRFKSLKEKDKEAPLSKKKLKEIDGFIKTLTSCAETADDIGDQPPDGIDHPVDHTTDPVDHTNDHPVDHTNDHTNDHPVDHTTDPVDHTNDDVATDDDADDADEDDVDDDDDEGVEETGTFGAKLVSVRATGGVALIDAGDNNDIPVQPAFVLDIGYPLAAGPVNLDVGAAVSFSPIPYGNATASLLGLLANVGVTYPVTEQIGVRADVGLGLLTFNGLEEGNPFTMGGVGTDGALGMFNARFAIAGDYAITDNIIATVTPFAFAYSPAKAGLDMSSLTQMQFMLGLGYRM